MRWWVLKSWRERERERERERKRGLKANEESR